MKKIILLVVVLCSTFFATADNLEIKNIWARAAEADKSTAVYMEITNSGSQDYEVIGIESDIAKMTMLHKTVIENGVSQMVHIDHLVVPANETIKLEPKGLHIMLIGLKKDLKIDDSFEVKLLLKGHDSKVVTVFVKNN